MAVATVTEVTGLIPVGDLFVQVFESALTAADSTWIATNFSDVVGVLGVVPILGSASTAEPSVQLNAQGTTNAEDSSMGDLGVQVTGSTTWQVTVIGKVPR